MTRHSLTLGGLLAATLALAACGSASTVAPSTATAGSTTAAQPSAAPASQPDAPASVDPGTPSSAPAVSGPVDVCALLGAADVASLVPGAVATAGEPDGGPITSYSCTWDEGSPSAPIPASLSVQVSPNFVSQSVAASGFTADLLKQVTSGAATNDGGSVIDGLGDLGVVDPISHLGPEVTFFSGDAMVQLDYSADNGQARQDDVVAVARLVAGRLP